MSNYPHHHAAGWRRPPGPAPAAALRRLPLLLLASAAAAGSALAQPDAHQWPAANPAPAAAPGPAPAGMALEVYGDRDELLDAVAGIDLVHEDFSDNLVQPSGLRLCYQAVGHRSDDPCFLPGALAPGFGMRSSRGSIFDANQNDIDLILLDSYQGHPTPLIGNNVLDSPRNPVRIDFDPPVTVVGMDVMDGQMDGPVQLEAYDGDGVLLGSFTVQPEGPGLTAFAGLVSQVPVGRVDVNAPTEGGGELIGRLLFGGGPGRLAAVGDEFDLGTVTAGSAAASFQLANSGHLALPPLHLQPLPAPFVLAADDCSGGALDGGATCALAIAVSGTHPGVHLARWQPLGDAGPTIGLRADVVSAQLEVSPGHLDFGAVLVGGSSQPLSVDVYNSSGAVISASLPSLLPAPFSLVSSSCPAGAIEFLPDEYCELEIVFSPQAAGDHDSELPVQGPAGQLARLTLYGRGQQGGAQ